NKYEETRRDRNFSQESRKIYRNGRTPIQAEIDNNKDKSY
ncbi:18519_t:CDS:1, partial [Gigaspora rosea]